MARRSPRRPPPEILAYYDELVNTLARRLGSRHDAEDVAHEAIVRMLTANVSAIEKPRAYLHQTARNLATDAYRRHIAHEIIPLDLIEESVASASNLDVAIYAAEIVSALEVALADIPLRCRQVFVWQRIGGMTQAEIADRLGVSKSMVVKYMMRAMQHLRERLTDFDPD